MMFTQDEAEKLLLAADLFFDDGPRQDTETGESFYLLNMNDAWYWACADGERVKKEELPELARLYSKYGWCGVLYWVSKKNNDRRSEFADNNRFIDFVAHEERLSSEVPNSSERAYKRIVYTLGQE